MIIDLHWKRFAGQYLCRGKTPMQFVSLICYASND